MVPLALVDTWLSDDERPTRQGERWVNAIATQSDGGLAVSSFWLAWRQQRYARR
jgi:hypothetical protein